MSFPHKYTATPTGHPSVTALPPANTERWTARRKASILKAIQGKVITREDAKGIYNLSDKELTDWERTWRNFGLDGLKISSIPSHR